LLPAAAAGALGLNPPAARANEPVKRPAGSLLKPALNVYSFLPLLEAEIKHPGTGLTLYDLLDFCVKHGLEGIDATSYFFAGYPKIPPDSYLYEFKRRAYELGIHVFGTGTHDVLMTEDKGARAGVVAHIKQWIEVAARLGASVLRVFADDVVRHESWTKLGPGRSRQEVEAWMADDLRECAEHGRRHGVIIGVQNHGDFNADATDFLRLIGLVGSDWCAPVLDTGNFSPADPYESIARVAPYAVNVMVKQSVFDGGYGAEPIDLVKLLRIVRAAGYSGYLSIEALFAPGQPADPLTAVPAFARSLRAAIAATA
jgi:sugar phosphate isomerase/epimerase